MAKVDLDAKMLAALQGCKDVKEVVDLAKSQGLEMDEEKARKVMSIVQSGKLSDEDLDKVVGGSSCAGDIEEKCK